MIYQPRDQSDIYLKALDSRLRQMQNPYANVPQAVGQFGQQLTAMQAHKNLSEYLSMPEDQKALPENKQKFYQSAMLMGVDPSKLISQPTQKVDPITLENTKEKNRETLAGVTAGLKKTNAPTGFTQPQIDSWVTKIKSGKAILNDIPGGMSANSLRAKVASVLGMDQNYDVGKANVGRAAQVAGASAGARLTEGGAAQMTARTANAANQQLDILEDVSKKFPRSNVQAMNTPIIAFDRQTYPEAQNWIIAVNSFRNEYASALMRGHMPQEQAQHEVARALPDNITPAQLESAIPLLRRELAALVAGQMTPASGPTKPKKDPMGLFR